MGIRTTACLLAFFLAGCASVPRGGNFEEESFQEVSVRFSELYDSYQQSLGVKLTHAELEKNSSEAYSHFRSEIERAASLRISNVRDEKRLLDQTNAAAKNLSESQRLPADPKAFAHWLAAQVLEGKIKDPAQLKFSFVLLSNEVERPACPSR